MREFVSFGTGWPKLSVIPPPGAAAPFIGSGGIIGDLSSAANQLGVGQAMDLLKGIVVPGIQQAIQNAGSAAAAAPAAAAAAPVADAAAVAAAPVIDAVGTVAAGG